MNKTKRPEAFKVAKRCAIELSYRDAALSALLSGALSLLRDGDDVNGIELLEIAGERLVDATGFQTLNAALEEMGASHE